MGSEGQQPVIPHVLIFPAPIQSPVNTMLKIAELLCLAGVQVTFLITKHNYSRLLRCTDIQARAARYEGRFHLETIDDGLPPENPRDVISEITDSLRTKAGPFFRQLVQARGITCVIAGRLYRFALDITDQLGLPLVFMETVSPSCLLVYLYLTKLIEDGELPIKGNDLDKLVTGIPGMEGFLRLRDLPEFCRRNYTVDRDATVVFDSMQDMPRAAGIILNSFVELEGPVLSLLSSKLVGSLYCVGPVQLHLQAAQQQSGNRQNQSKSNSFWEEDRTCFKWLDSQPPKSVLYISFGSLVKLPNEKFSEFWHGVINSGHRFVWVIRPGSILGQGKQHDEFLEGLNREANGIGMVVGWVPQEEVLADAAIGGFLTHSGWNSTLESVIAGVPMICWPTAVDQQVTSRFVSEVWKLGIDIKDTCDRFTIEKSIRDLMGSKGEFSDTAKKWSELARESVARDDGSSHLDFNRLVRDIKKWSSK